MKRLLMLVVVMLSCGNALATDQSYETNAIEDYKNQLVVLYKAGVDLHHKYDFRQVEHLQHCVNRHSNLRDEAKAIQNKISKEKKAKVRTELHYPAKKVFECVYCSAKTGQACDEAELALIKVQNRLDKPPTKIDFKSLLQKR